MDAIFRAVPPNSYRTLDVIAALDELQNGNVWISGVVTSPPYSKRFRGRGGRSSNWAASRLMESDYDGYADNMDEQAYIIWQRRFLSAATALVGDTGVVMYNIGRRLHQLTEDRRAAILEGFPVRQTVMWDRGSTNNMGGKRPSILPPIYEQIHIIAGAQWRLPTRYLAESRSWGDVWRVPFQHRNPHPAPFPPALAERMVKLVDGPVCDPFAGSGTVGIAAQALGYDYYLSDVNPAYATLYCDRLRKGW